MSTPTTNTSEMTYRERYDATVGWEARHIARDLMELNGPDEFISEQDDARISKAEQRDGRSQLSNITSKCFSIMGLE